MTSWLHEERLQAVEAALRDCGARRVLDLGCGEGDLFVRLARQERFDTLIGIDICAASLARLRDRLAHADVRAGHIDLRIASMVQPPPDLRGFDCALLVETIEHTDPAHLSRLKRALFHELRPERVVITTPNAEFNALLGVPAGRMRRSDHRFEWTRAEFQAWCGHAAQGAGYRVMFSDVGGAHPDLGAASQMAVFDLAHAWQDGKDGTESWTE